MLWQSQQDLCGLPDAAERLLVVLTELAKALGPGGAKGNSTEENKDDVMR